MQVLEHSVKNTLICNLTKLWVGVSKKDYLVFHAGSLNLKCVNCGFFIDEFFI